MNARVLFNASAIIEILTGFALLFVPVLVIGLLLGEGLSSIGVAVARVLGVGLLSVGIAGFEATGQASRLTTRAGLCIYNVGAAVVFAIFGALNVSSGILLWPVVVIHGLIGAVMLRIIVSSLYRTA